MGLDSVNLVVAIEQEFAVQISDEIAPRLSVLGNLHLHGLTLLRQRGEKPDETETWQRLRRVVVDQLGVKPGEVTRSADIVKDLRAD